MRANGGASRGVLERFLRASSREWTARTDGARWSKPARTARTGLRVPWSELAPMAGIGCGAGRLVLAVRTGLRVMENELR